MSDMLANLRAAEIESIRERKGLLCPTRHPEMFETALRRFGSLTESKNPASGETDSPKQRFRAAMLDQQFRYMAALMREGSLPAKFRMSDPGLFLRAGALQETTTSADIATITQQVLAFIDPIFERIVIDQLVHMRVMQGPTALLTTLDFLQGDAGDFYSEGTSFQGRLDVDYSDCPTECTAYQTVDMSVTQTTINALCKSLSADWCLQAEQDYSSQHGRSIADDIRAFMQLQIAREKQGEVLADLVASAGYSGTWSSTIPGGSVYLTLDPKVYDATLFDAILDADNEIFKSAGGYRGANWLAADPDSLLRLEKLNRFSLKMRDNVPRAQAGGPGSIDEFGNFFGVGASRYNCWKFPYMAADKILLGVKSDAPQELAYIHAELVPLADLGIWRNPANGNIVTGMMSRYANAMVRAGLFATVDIT